jgi:hypothetical protein
MDSAYANIASRCNNCISQYARYFHNSLSILSKISGTSFALLIVEQITKEVEKMKTILILTLALAVALSASIVLAADYSKYTTDELNSMRGTMQNVTQQERDAFRAEWQKRIQNMTQEERQKYAGKPENAGQGEKMKQRKRIKQENTVRERDTVQGQGYGMGKGMGKGMRGGKGKGMGGNR